MQATLNLNDMSIIYTPKRREYVRLTRWSDERPKRIMNSNLEERFQAAQLFAEKRGLEFALSKDEFAFYLKRNCTAYDRLVARIDKLSINYRKFAQVCGVKLTQIWVCLSQITVVFRYANFFRRFPKTSNPNFFFAITPR